MIVVDTSALLAVVLSEPAGESCLRALKGDRELVVSAGTVVEIGVVSSGKDVAEPMSRLMSSLRVRIVAVDEVMAGRAIQAFRAYGKGRHPARLNYGDCFSYALAKHLDCPLLFIGDDFSQTDIRSVLSPS